MIIVFVISSIIITNLPHHDHYNKYPLAPHSIISCWNTVSVRLQRSEQNIFPPILNGLFMSADVAGTAKYLAASAARCGHIYPGKPRRSADLSVYSPSCTDDVATGWESAGCGAMNMSKVDTRLPGHEHVQEVCVHLGLFGGTVVSFASADEVALWWSDRLYCLNL